MINSKKDINIQDAISYYFDGKKLSKHEFIFSMISSLITLVLFYAIYSNWILTNAHWDLGWLKHVTWQNIFQKMPNTCCSTTENNSIYISWLWHFTPFFSIVSALSFLWPFSSFSWFAIFLAMAPALLVFFTCNIFFLQKILFSKFKALNYIFPILLSLSFGSIRAIAFPHYELYFLVFVLSAIYFAAQNSKFLYILSITMAVFLKEDSALYIIILVWFIFFKKISTWYLFKRTLLLLVTPFVYLVSLNFIQVDYPINPSFPNMTNLESQYLGKPLLSHISTNFLVDRLINIVQSNYILIIFIIFLTSIGFLTKNNLTIRLMLSTIPYFFVSIVALSWTKGEMLNYELLPIWTSVMLAVLLSPLYKLQLNNQKKLLTKIILMIFLFFGLINGSVKNIVNVARTPSPDANTVNLLDSLIIEAKENSFILDSNFFVYNQNLVSYNSWLKDLNELTAGQCFIHLPNSNTKKILVKNFSNFGLITNPFQDSSFQVTCLQNKTSSRN